jgi:UDP-GlcNAc3NAcA epimerase
VAILGSLDVRRRHQGRARPVVVTVFGTRPQFIKMSVLWGALEKPFRSILIDSGQHYDYSLAGVFHDEIGVRQPDYHLGIRGGGVAVQIGRIAESLDRRLPKLRPDALIVVGDTSTTAGGAIAAAYRGIPLAHIEAGLRSFDPAAPEEKNRIIADHLATWRFCPSTAAIDQLRAEGITAGVVGSGDLMYENWRRRQEDLRAGACPLPWGLQKRAFYFVTCHRAQNVDDPKRLRHLAAILGDLDQPAVFAVHPRARKNLHRLGLWSTLRRVPHLRMTPPLPHLTSLDLIASARVVLTDSGGIQREACWSRTPCVVLRSFTEWRELLAVGAGVLTDLDPVRVRRALRRPWRVRPIPDRVFRRADASRRITDRLARDLGRT